MLKVTRSVLDSVNPLAKIVVSVVMVGVAFSLRNLVAAGLLSASLMLLFFIAVPPAKRLHYFRSFMVGAIALLLFTGIAALLLQNLNFALLNSLRLVAILLPTPLLAITTPPADLTRALQAAKLPTFLVLGLMLTWRFLPLMQQESQRIMEANQLRGVDLRRQPSQWFPGLFVPLIFRMVSYADEVSIGLETRGYDPDAPRSMSQPIVWRTTDTLFVISSGLLLAVVLLANQGE
jgi:energy-coupling factor transport system permease protein